MNPLRQPPIQPRNQPRFQPARKALRWQDRSLLIIAIVLMSLILIRVETAQAQPQAQARAQNVVDSDETWGLELTPTGDDANNAESVRTLALNTDMKVEVSGLVARVEVTQQFLNTSGRWAEGVYRFPLPMGAAVDRMRIETAGRVLEGEIQEKQSARRSYQKARSSGKQASLVEQQRPNQFETRLANIGPGDEVLVIISFLSRVEFRDGLFSLQIPMTFTPSWSPASNGGEASGSAWQGPAVLFAGPTYVAAKDPAPIQDQYLTLAVELQTGFDLVQLESRYHDVDIHPTLNGYHVFLNNPDTRADRVFELNWAPDLQALPQSALLTWDGGDAVYAMLMLAPPLEQAVQAQARELVFVIDTSGSMEGGSLEQAKTALLEGLDLLDGHDRFNVIQFNSETELLFQASEPVDRYSLQAAGDYIDSLVANGGTDMGPALQAAMTLAAQPDLLRQIVFITDGSVGNESDLLLQIANQLQNSRLFTIAIGSAPNIWFMRKAAEIGRGNYTSIAQTSEVTERMNLLWTRIRTPAVQDVCIDWGMEAETYPEIIPDLYAGEPLWVLARLPLEPTEVTVCGELAGRYWEQSATLNAGRGSDNIAGLWARSKIEALEDSRIFGLDEAVLKQEITGVALQYGLLTSYTSLVAVDRSPVRPTGTTLASQSVPSLLPAGSTGSSVAFAQTATGWKIQILLSLITLLLACGIYFFCSVRLPMMSCSGRDEGAHA